MTSRLSDEELSLMTIEQKSKYFYFLCKGGIVVDNRTRMITRIIGSNRHPECLKCEKIDYIYRGGMYE